MSLHKLSVEIYEARRARDLCVPGTEAFRLANIRVAGAFQAWNHVRQLRQGVAL